jgi:hypothetical protein
MAERAAITSSSPAFQVASMSVLLACLVVESPYGCLACIILDLH